MMEELRKFLETSKSATFKSERAKTTYINKIIKIVEESQADKKEDAVENEAEPTKRVEDRAHYKRNGLEIVRPNGDKEEVGVSVMTESKSAQVDEANKRIQAERKNRGGSW